MTKREARSTNKSASAARRSRVVEIPDDLSAAIKRCWPRSVVEEFDTDESYFQEIRHQMVRKLEILRQEVVSIMTFIAYAFPHTAASDSLPGLARVFHFSVSAKR